MKLFHYFCAVSAYLFTLSVATSEVEKNDYHIYELIDKAHAQKYQNLYQVFGLEWGASPDTISAVFRKVSVRYHPDKYRNKTPQEVKEATEIYGFLTSVADLLRSSEGRSRYNWILNEAPPWHKSTFYARKIVQFTAKHSLSESLLLLLIVFTIGDYLVRISAWAIAWLQRWDSRRQVQEFGHKEKKRMMRKIERSTSPNFLGMVDSNFDALSRSQAPLPPFPRPWNVVFISKPLYYISSLALLCSTKLKRS